MKHKLVRVQRENAVTVVTINRPPVGNARNAAAQVGFEPVFDAFEREGDQRGAIITGVGDRAFLRGTRPSTNSRRKVSFPSFREVYLTALRLERP